MKQTFSFEKNSVFEVRECMLNKKKQPREMTKAMEATDEEQNII